MADDEYLNRLYNLHKSKNLKKIAKIEATTEYSSREATTEVKKKANKKTKIASMLRIRKHT